MCTRYATGYARKVGLDLMAAQQSSPPPRTLTVFFEGTANTIVPVTTTLGVLFNETDATDISDPTMALPDGATHCKVRSQACHAYRIAERAERLARRRWALTAAA